MPFTQVLFAWLFLLTLPNETLQGYRGIVPLHSTRSEVERLLGRSSAQCKCLYKTNNATVYVEYAVDNCKGIIPGWNVPKDTVLRLTVRSEIQRQFSDLNLDLSKYKMRQDDTFTMYYSSGKEGIEYEVSRSGAITSISYVPPITEKNLRCSGFPVEDGSTFDYQAFDKFGDVNVDAEDARLDTFAIMLLQSSSLKGYIVVYAGKTACPREALLRSNRARDYLIRRRGLDSKRIQAIDGGYRKDLAVELYAVPLAAEPPAVVPTLAASEATIVSNVPRCRRLGTNF